MIGYEQQSMLMIELYIIVDDFREESEPANSMFLDTMLSTQQRCIVSWILWRSLILIEGRERKVHPIVFSFACWGLEPMGHRMIHLVDPLDGDVLHIMCM